MNLDKQSGYYRQKAGVGLIIGLVVALGTFSFAPILVRAAGKVDPISLATVRTVSAILLLAPFWIFYRNKHAISTYTTTDNIYAALAGLCLGLHFILWIASLSYTSVASASVLVTFHSIILIFIEGVIFKRSFSSYVWVGVILAFSGSVLLGYSDSTSAQNTHENPLLGNIMALTAAVLFAVYFLLSQRLRQKSDWLNYIFRVYGFTAIACVTISLFLNVSFEMGKEAWLVAFALAIGPQIIGHGTMNYAVRSISPTFLSTLILAEPFGASLLALIILAELPPPQSLLCLTVIMTGIIITWYNK